jgi:hypothetical protein
MKMKKLPVCLSALALGALVLAGCSNLLIEKPRQNFSGETAAVPQGLGTLRVNLTRGAARTIMPQADLDVLSLEYRFLKEGAAAEKKAPEGGIFTLEPGAYTLEVNAYAVENDPESLAAHGEASFTVSPGVEAAVDLPLRPVLDEGAGSLSFSLEYPADAAVETLTLTRVGGDEDPIDLAAVGSLSGAGPFVLKGTRTDIPAGYYLLRVLLRNSIGAPAGKVEVVHVYRNLVAEAEYVFAADDFMVYRVSSVNDSGPGSLREALANALTAPAVLRVIQVSLESGSVIELQSPLPSIDRSLVIEGNGVTMTPASSWTVSDSRMLNIVSNTVEVTVRRVHFKNDLSASRDGAIYNRGILTLESCIFSGNSVASFSRTGGALHNSGGSLTIRGCTFYGNIKGRNTQTSEIMGDLTPEAMGGAVYFYGKTLTLTGNLFYGNTAQSFPVMYNYRTSPGAINASYNVVDVDFGTAADQCGWIQGEGDMQISGLVVSPINFKLFSWSGAEGMLPEVLPQGYPKADFYGNPINGGGAAGAVQAYVSNVYNSSYLELTVNESSRGSVTPNPAPNAEGLYTNGTAIAITAAPAAHHSFRHWLVDGVRDDSPTLHITLSAHTRVQAVFGLVVDNFTNEYSAGTLRYALSHALDGDLIPFTGVEPGVTTIELKSSLEITAKNITIEGSGITLTSPGVTLKFNGGIATIRRVHFKNGNGEVNSEAGAIYKGRVTLESCIFSGNLGGAGAITVGDSVIRGCTFYGNTGVGNSSGAGAVRASGSLTLTGNLFYRNATARMSSWTFPVVNSDEAVNASYNVVDAAFGTAADQSGWTQGTGDQQADGPTVSGISFKLLPGSAAAGKLPVILPEDYPATDFYGNPIGPNAAAGAVQATAAGNGYYPDVSVDVNSLIVIPNTSVKSPGSFAVNSGSSPDPDGLYTPGSVLTITALPNPRSVLERWLVNGVETASTGPNTLTITLSGHTKVQAVFAQDQLGTVTVTDFSDGPGSETTPGTLRYALANVLDGDIITFSGVTPGVTTIPLNSTISFTHNKKNFTIEGNGITLTRAPSWTPRGGSSDPLLAIGLTADVRTVTIRRVHFKDGLSKEYAGAIDHAGSNSKLIFESCIFSGNRTMTAGSNSGGAIFNYAGPLTIRGCTFYGNIAGGGSVKVIHSIRTVTMTGNLFYGNSDPGVYKSATHSYNVVDAALADAGTGDTQITGLPVSPVTFKLLSGSGAAGKLPNPLPDDYPTVDFYGNVINGGGAAGAVQTGTTTPSALYLDLPESDGGSIAANLAPDSDGLYPANSSIIITATPNPGHSFGSWLVDGVPHAVSDNPLSINLSAHTTVKALFARVVTVSDFTDGPGSANTPGTLRYALTNARDGDLIAFSGVTPGVTTIELQSRLPEITRSITIEGSGVTLTPNHLFSPDSLYISDTTAAVTIRRVHFKEFRVGAIRSDGDLTLESCIFSSNRIQATGGGVYGSGTVTIRGCTFYNNTANNGGAVYASGVTILMGNLFYGNSASNTYPVVYPSTKGTISASYNAADADFGTGATQSGWTQGTGDKMVTQLPALPLNFKLLSSSGAAAMLPPVLPPEYPTVDFYGNAINGGGAAGAVQATETGYYLDLSVNADSAGSVSLGGASPGVNGLYLPGSALTITAFPQTFYSVQWLVNGVNTPSTGQNTLSITLSADTWVQAVFAAGVVTVNDFRDTDGSGTLRYALANARDGDLITFSGVTPGVTTIELQSRLPYINKSIVIEGNGITLTRSANWTSDASSQLLLISYGEVTIRRVHFKNGLATGYGAAIRNGGNLTLESCIFSGNSTPYTSIGTRGGAIYSSNVLTIRGCTFYNNNAGNYSGSLSLSYAFGGGAVCFVGFSENLTLEGNLFYENTASDFPVLRIYDVAKIIAASSNSAVSYNVVDTDFGVEYWSSGHYSGAGWTAGTGDSTLAALGIDGAPLDPATFAPVSALGNVLPSTRPADFPLMDFYGVERSFPGAPGAVR